jgi:drug/metabolite transporter (DMT)-like permease
LSKLFVLFSHIDSVDQSDTDHKLRILTETLGFQLTSICIFAHHLVLIGCLCIPNSFKQKRTKAKDMIGELAALGAAISWTVSALFYGRALQEARPISANIIRLTLTGSIMLLFLVVIGKLSILTGLPSEVAGISALSGIIGLGVGDTLYLVSLSRIGVARTVPITCIYPLFTLVWATFLEGEPITWAVVLGAVVIVGGIWLLGRDTQASTVDTKGKPLVVGVILALLTAILWSISITMMDVAVTETPDLDHALAINTMRVIAIAAFLFVASPLIDRKLSFLKVPKRTVMALVAGGIVALGLGWFFLAYSLVQVAQSRAVPLSSTTPLFSTLASVYLLREKVTARTALGALMIVFGIFLVFLA